MTIRAITSGNALGMEPSRESLREAARALLAKGHRLWRQHEGSTLELRAGTRQPQGGAASCVSLEFGGGRLALALEREPAGSPLGDLHWQDYEGEARLLAWALAHEALLDALAPLFGAVLPVAFATTGDASLFRLELSFQAGAAGEYRGWLGLDGEALRLLAHASEWKPQPGSLATLGEVASIDLNLIVAGRPLEAAAIAALTPGDVLMIGVAEGCEGRLQPDREQARDVFGLPDGWAVLWQQGRWLVAPRSQLGANAAARPQFLLTGLSATLDEVAALQPGAVAIAEAALLGGTVGIMWHGRRYGEGVLVGLGAWLGVRITHKEAEHGSR